MLKKRKGKGGTSSWKLEDKSSKEKEAGNSPKRLERPSGKSARVGGAAGRRF